jgi:Cys-tRNA(Pro)/Cys-tRNA(Cys) deacylase
MSSGVLHAAPKTNAARLLDSLGIAYEIRSVEVDENDLSAVALARELGVPEEQVFKTLVAHGGGASGRETLMACIPGPAELDLKKLARAAGHKSAVMARLKEVFPLTGYVRGGCSPLAAKKRCPVFVDESAVLWETVFVSAGLRGVQLLLAPDDLLRAVSGVYADLCKELMKNGEWDHGKASD